MSPSLRGGHVARTRTSWSEDWSSSALTRLLQRAEQGPFVSVCLSLSLFQIFYSKGEPLNLEFSGSFTYFKSRNLIKVVDPFPRKIHVTQKFVLEAGSQTREAFSQHYR